MKIDLKTLKRQHAQPMHQQLSNLIRGAIWEKVYSPGERIEPERTFTQEGKLSRPTVSRAFRDLAAEGLIVRRMGSGTFVADIQNAAPPRLHKIGVCYYNTHTPYFESVFRGIQAECRLHHIETQTINVGFTEENEAWAVRELLNCDSDGLIAMSFGSTDIRHELMNIAEQRIPVSSIGLHIPGVKCDSVTFNLEHGIYETARYLIDMGHRRIGMVGTNYRYPVVYSQTILRSIQRAYSEHDLPYKERKVLLPVFVDEADPHWHNEILKLIQGDEPVTAMITSSDGLARYVGDILDNQGIQIPKDVSITGYDDLPFASKLSPPLTTISAPTERAGREAVRQVINRHMFPDRDPIQLMLDTSLIIRRSTVPPSTNTLSLKANT